MEMIEQGDKCPKCQIDQMPKWAIGDKARRCQECGWIEELKERILIRWGGKVYGPFQDMKEVREYGFILE
jgi:hypothetical protein